MEICSSTLGIFCPSDFLMCLWNCQWEESQTEKVLVSDPESHEEDKKHRVMIFTVTVRLKTGGKCYLKICPCEGWANQYQHLFDCNLDLRYFFSIMKYPTTTLDTHYSIKVYFLAETPYKTSPKEDPLEVFYCLVFYITPLLSSGGFVVLVTVVM